MDVIILRHGINLNPRLREGVDGGVEMYTTFIDDLNPRLREGVDILVISCYTSEDI